MRSQRGFILLVTLIISAMLTAMLLQQMQRIRQQQALSQVKAYPLRQR